MPPSRHRDWKIAWKCSQGRGRLRCTIILIDLQTLFQSLVSLMVVVKRSTKGITSIMQISNPQRTCFCPWNPSIPAFTCLLSCSNDQIVLGLINT